MWNLTAQEFNTVTQLKAQERYSYALKRIADREELWGLANSEGWVVVANVNNEVIFPVWPHADYARACAKDEWEDCEPQSIALNDFLEKWIPGLGRDKRQVAVFPTAEAKGVVVQPDRLYDDLQEQLEQFD